MAAPRLKALSAADVQELLDSWARLNDDVMSLSRHAVKQLLEAEVNGRRRHQVLLRLYGRYSKLRRRLEWQNLVRDGTLPW